MKTEEIRNRILAFVQPPHHYRMADIGRAVFGQTTRAGDAMKDHAAIFAIGRYVNALVREGVLRRWRYNEENGGHTYRYGYPDKGLFDEME